MACHGLVDGGLHTAPTMAGPTWRNSRGVERRLDYIFLSRSLGQLSRRLLPVFFSDHDGVLLQVGAPVCLFGRGYWKLEREVLDEQAFVNGFVDFFRGLEGLRSMCEGVLEWWEIAKVRIRVFILGYCKRKKREERREVDHIQRLLELELEAGNLGGSVDWERSSALKAQLREVHEQKACAFLECAHSGFLEHDETCSAVFLNQLGEDRVGRGSGRGARSRHTLLVPGSGGLHVKMKQYTDDTSLLLCKDSCLTRSFAIIGEFTQASGAVLNHAKSSVKWRGRTDVPAGISLCIGALKILGVLFETSGSATLNWNKSIAVVQRKLGMWRARSLSFIGKVLVLKVDVLPSLLYMAYIYPLPASLRRPLVRLVFQFMWGGRLERVARVRMLCPIGEGGRGVPHFPLKLDSIFVSYLLTELAHPVIHPSGYFLLPPSLCLEYQPGWAHWELGSAALTTGLRWTADGSFCPAAPLWCFEMGEVVWRNPLEREQRGDEMSLCCQLPGSVCYTGVEGERLYYVS
ncbi:unnamed protein product, partial [Coregonus sp. 'balchen']